MLDQNLFRLEWSRSSLWTRESVEGAGKLDKPCLLFTVCPWEVLERSRLALDLRTGLWTQRSHLSSILSSHMSIHMERCMEEAVVICLVLCGFPPHTSLGLSTLIVNKYGKIPRFFTRWPRQFRQGYISTVSCLLTSFMSYRQVRTVFNHWHAWHFYARILMPVFFWGGKSII